ncbi:hypothetical protein [Streptomyces sp. NPDC018000]
MDKPIPITRQLTYAAFVSLASGAAWAAGSECVAGLVWWVQHR